MAASELITPETRADVLADLWFASLDDRSPTTLQLYRHHINAQIKLSLGPPAHPRAHRRGGGPSPAP